MKADEYRVAVILKDASRIGAFVAFMATLILMGCLTMHSSGEEDAAVPEEHVIAHYALDGNALDHSDHKNHGKEHNGVEYVPGVVGQAAVFNGTNSFILVDATEDNTEFEEITLAAWINVTQFPPELAGLVTRWNLDHHRGDYYGFWLDGHYFPEKLIGSSHEYHNVWTSHRAPIELDAWTHVAYVISPKCKHERFYVNGTLVSQKERHGKLRRCDLPILIGADIRTYGEADYYRFFNGAIDEVVILNRALSEADIQRLYKSQKSKSSAPLRTAQPADKREGTPKPSTAGNQPADDKWTRVFADENMKSLNIREQITFTDEMLESLKTKPHLTKIYIAAGEFQSFILGLTDRELSHFSEVKTLESLVLYDGEYTDKGMEYISRLTNLKELIIPNCDGFTDAGYEYLTRLQHLETLYLRGNDITDIGVKHVARLTGLKSLRFLVGPDMTNEGLAALTALKSLHTLDVRGRGISLSGLEQINTMTNLTWLDVSSIKEHDTVLDLSGLTQLERLELSNVRDQDLAFLTKLERLKKLHIGGKEVTDAGLEHLAGIESLTHLRFGCYTRVTKEGMAWLAERVPGLEVVKTPVSPL